MNSLNNLQTLSSRWNTLLNLEEEEVLPPYLNPPMILLLWNCRGIHNRNFKIHLRDIIAYHKPAIIVPIETKAGRKEADRIMESFNYANSTKVHSDGQVGGIYILWTNQVEVQPVAITQQEIYFFINVLPQNSSFILTAVYSRPYLNFKQMLWHNLKSFHTTSKDPWLVLGDFHEITSISEKFGGTPINQNRLNSFKSLLNNCNLLDFGFTGPKFTWTNLRKNSQLIMERLDRCLANPSWLNLFPSMIVMHLPRMHSDHCPILLNTNPYLPRDKEAFSFGTNVDLTSELQRPNTWLLDSTFKWFIWSVSKKPHQILRIGMI